MILIGSQLGIHQFVGDNPESAKKIASSLLDYTLPAGYIEQGGRDLGVIKMVLITPEGLPPQFHLRHVILLTTYSKALGLSEDQFRQELRLAMLRSVNEVTTMEYIRDVTTTIRGEELTLKVYESFGEYDTPTRMMFSSAFPGKSGDVILGFAGPIGSWNQEIVNRFIESIK